MTTYEVLYIYTFTYTYIKNGAAIANATSVTSLRPSWARQASRGRQDLLYRNRRPRSALQLWGLVLGRRGRREFEVRFWILDFGNTSCRFTNYVILLFWVNFKSSSPSISYNFGWKISIFFQKLMRSWWCRSLLSFANNDVLQSCFKNSHKSF